MKAIAIFALCAVTASAATLSPVEHMQKLKSAPPPKVTPNLFWNKNPETNIATYRVYSGPASRRYTNAVDVGTSTNYRLRLVLGTNYMAITAINSNALESDFSAELAVVRWPHTAITLRVPTNRWWILRGPALGRLTNWFNVNGPTNVTISVTNGPSCFLWYQPFYVSPIAATAKGTISTKRATH
jgi:hypothetical protein